MRIGGIGLTPLADDEDYELSGDKKWIYLTGTPFATDYAANCPHDDFAESFAAYFMDYANFSGEGDGGASHIAGPGGKLEFIAERVIKDLVE